MGSCVLCYFLSDLLPQGSSLLRGEDSLPGVAVLWLDEGVDVGEEAVIVIDWKVNADTEVQFCGSDVGVFVDAQSVGAKMERSAAALSNVAVVCFVAEFRACWWFHARVTKPGMTKLSCGVSQTLWSGF